MVFRVWAGKPTCLLDLLFSQILLLDWEIQIGGGEGQTLGYP